MTRFVVDASVAVKWFLTEEHSDAAERLLTAHHERIAPELVLVEAAHVFVKRHRRGELSTSDAQVSLAALHDTLQVRESASLVSTALDLAFTHQRSAYDGLYVALALRESCELITADRKLYEALSPQFPSTMLWVEDIPADDA
jgi:predicted nucleic acid-binding protein